MANPACQVEPPVVPRHRSSPPHWARWSVVLLIGLGTLGAVFGGPILGDHEAIVAQCARNMRTSGDWVVPQIFDTPFFRKPPLPYWLIAAGSYVLPDDPETGLPVTTLAARLPSGLAAFVTVLLTWRLASSMFNPCVGLVTGMVAGSSLAVLMYGANATAEILLTMCCTWAYLHFWHAATARAAWPRFVHAMLFYVAMGFGMLAKGPAPIALVAIPLFAWWYAERPLRVLARRGLRGWRCAVLCFLRSVWPRTVQAFSRLWLLPGLIVFAALFVPWMLAVARRYPHAWDLWNWQYVQRAEGSYEDTRDRGVLYYLPITIGLTLPWLFLVLEALLAPWLKRYARWDRALLYAGHWTVLGVAVLSLMSFKKPYYILPALPGLLLLMGVVAHRVYGSAMASWSGVVRRKAAWTIWAILAGVSVGLLAWGGMWVHKTLPAAAAPMMVVACGAVVALLLAGVFYIRGRGWAALGITAATAVAAFQLVWHVGSDAIDAAGDGAKARLLARALDDAGVPRGATLFWTDRRPDSRLSFYFGRPVTYLVTPEEIVTRMVDRTNKLSQIRGMVFKRAIDRLGEDVPAYMVLQQGNYDLVRHSLPRGVHVIAAVEGADRPDKGWVVITNAPGHAPAGTVTESASE